MTPIRTLVDRDQDKLKPGLPPGLRDLYDGDLHFQASPAERPFVFANFVSTLDGVVSYAIKGHANGSVISGSDPADRFIMGLLRASADAIIVGARTAQDTGPQSLWTAESIYPDARMGALDRMNFYQKARGAHFRFKALDYRTDHFRILDLRRESAKTCEPLLAYTNVSPIPLSNGARSESMA